MIKIKTRFAPSPTGDMHIGSLRTALYNYLFAKKNNGQFFLRIEDTDQARYQQGSVENIIEALNWAGIGWDKYQITNDKLQIPNNNFDGVVFQSKRISLYQEYANQLVNRGDAYYCFCSEQDLAQMRDEQIKAGQAAKYDRRCLKLEQEEVRQKLDAGTPHVVRMKIPESVSSVKVSEYQSGGNKIILNDLVRGQIEFNLKELDDQIILKSDGFPTYHLANVVDDHEMQISHVLRAEEWLPSTPKHIILYQMLGWSLPEFAHIPLILAQDNSKLSKRHGATSVLEFKKQGYLPQALVNYLALLGWNPGGDREFFSLTELEKEFSLEKVQKSGAIFDLTKLEWMNGNYIRNLTQENLAERCMPYLIKAGLLEENDPRFSDEYIIKVVALEQQRIKKISDIAQLTDYFFKDIDYNKELLKWKKSDLTSAKERLQYLIENLQDLDEENFTKEKLEEFILDLIKSQGIGTGDTLWPMRVALTGREKSPGPFEVAEVLGKKEVLERINRAIDKLS